MRPSLSFSGSTWSDTALPPHTGPEEETNCKMRWDPAWLLSQGQLRAHHINQLTNNQLVRPRTRTVCTFWICYGKTSIWEKYGIFHTTPWWYEIRNDFIFTPSLSWPRLYQYDDLRRLFDMLSPLISTNKDQLWFLLFSNS